MSSNTNIQNTGYVVNINNANVDIANLATSWSDSTTNGSRQLIRFGTISSRPAYYFPTIGVGFNSTFNGQIITIYNNSNNLFYIYTGNAQVYYDGRYYGANESFQFSNTVIAMFILVHGEYYVEIYTGNIS